jgi:hypothetical protein
LFCFLFFFVLVCSSLPIDFFVCLFC